MTDIENAKQFEKKSLIALQALGKAGHNGINKYKLRKKYFSNNPLEYNKFLADWHGFVLTHVNTGFVSLSSQGMEKYLSGEYRKALESCLPKKPRTIGRRSLYNLTLLKDHPNGVRYSELKAVSYGGNKTRLDGFLTEFCDLVSVQGAVGKDPMVFLTGIGRDFLLEKNYTVRGQLLNTKGKKKKPKQQKSKAPPPVEVPTTESPSLVSAIEAVSGLAAESVAYKNTLLKIKAIIEEALNE